LIEVQPEIRKDGFCVLGALSNLLKIAFSRAPAFVARVDIAVDLAVGRDVILRDGNELHVTNDVNVSFGRVERDKLGPLQNARGRGIDASGLPPDLVDGGKSVKEQLPEDNRGLLPVQPAIIPGRRGRDVLIETFGA